MRREDRNRRASASSRHCGRWKNIIAAETDFAVDLPTNRLLVSLTENTAPDSLKFQRRLAAAEMNRELELVVVTDELSGRADFLIARFEDEIRDDRAKNLFS